MSLPAGARVRAVPQFLACLQAIQQALAAHDASSAPRRFAALQAELRKARSLLAFAPASGRPARLLQARTGWGRHQAWQARQLAQAAGVPELRELVLARHVLLYAHSDHEVVLLSLRHERQLGFPLEGP